MSGLFLTGPARPVNGSCLLVTASSTQQRDAPMSIVLRLSQEQFGTLTSALDRAIERSTDDAAEALRKHNIARHRRLSDDVKEYDKLKQIIEIQLTHHQGPAGG